MRNVLLSIRGKLDIHLINCLAAVIRRACSETRESKARSRIRPAVSLRCRKPSSRQSTVEADAVAYCRKAAVAHQRDPSPAQWALKGLAHSRRQSHRGSSCVWQADSEYLGGVHSSRRDVEEFLLCVKDLAPNQSAGVKQQLQTPEQPVDFVSVEGLHH